MVYKLVRNQALFLHYDGKHFKYESVLKPFSGIVDKNHRKIQPGDIVIMLEDGTFETINEFKPKPN
ncbi:MAG TPA: hypothetical protein DIW23_05965 [Anaerolineae bacterium]|nr:hypothetical protein [Anaerolineae bacterium]